MKRFLLILVLVVVAVSAAMWWGTANRLSAEEERLVGTWLVRDPNNGWSPMTLDRDRTYHFLGPDGKPLPPTGSSSPSAHWCVRDGALVVDLEMNSIRRLLRPVADRMGLAIGEVARFQLVSVAENELIFASGGSARIIFIRAPPVD